MKLGPAEARRPVEAGANSALSVIGTGELILLDQIASARSRAARAAGLKPL
jgi:hypothetical protein